ncbi:hypothetical protein COLU111180_12570 [Cohnella lubricantis]|uniref:Uncharacterized protein n=1 Tax=Cohnella lubricantis TaxID=2163172 RepID=A0A841T3Z6_9BACL|nr:hypothetical protein [Cohnella lubricantis]MBB6676064.1 hypothetical protein [Cohnella lubricantis]MBP2118019.1 hypothetical protein [Cohnella lubricantis]
MNKTAWARMRKHAAIPALGLGAALLLAIGASTYAMKDEAAFELNDLSGSREAIADAVISGELRDGYHSVHFHIENGKLRTETEVFRQPEFTYPYHYVPGADKRIDDTMFSVEGLGTFEILSLKPKLYNIYYVPDGKAIVTPTIHYGKDENGNIDLANPLEYGIAKNGDRVFFTVPVSSRSTGSSGIYELNFFHWADELFVNAQKQYPPRLIAELDLRANESAEQPNIEVLGLEAVGDKLVLISAANGELVIRSFDSGSGALLGEAALPNFQLQRPAAEAERSDGAIAYSSSYEAFSDSKLGILNLSFRGSRSRQLMLSADLADGVRIVNQVEADRSEEESQHLIDERSAIRYLNGKLYVIRAYKEARSSDPNDVNEIARPHRFYLYVYDQSKLAYKGELVTDQNDDYEDGTIADGDMRSRSYTNLAID